MAVKKYQKVILILIILFATFLRFYSLSSNPPGLYWDEVIFGYDAYSIIKTAHDHNGNFLPLFFESYGDWKLPVYHYLLVPSILVFGLNEFAVRFPSASFGVLTIIVFFYLLKKLTANINLALLASFFLAISPWHIQFSRGGFESTAGLFLALTGTYLLIIAIHLKNSLAATASGIFFVFSMYSYHAYRIFIPAFVLVLAVIYRKELKKMAASLVIPLAIALFLSVPLIWFSLSTEGKSRATSQSAFKKEDLEKARIDYDQKSKKPLRFMSKYLYQKPVYYAYLAAKGYVSHFSPTFLFTKGDQIGRHSQVDMGQIYIFEAALILVALFNLKMTTTAKIFLAWLLISPIPASIVTPTPHAYRTLQMVIPLVYLTSLGTYQIISQRKPAILKILLAFFALYWFASYLHLLFVHYPKKFAADWQSGYKQMVEKVKKHQDSFENVYITNINQVPYAYVLFYEKYDPQKYFALNGNKDHFDKYYFIDNSVNVYNKGRILYVAPSWEKVDGIWLDAVDDASGRHIYSLWELGGQK